jgi:glutamate dehydrogenase/leucine dehydrogenase
MVPPGSAPFKHRGGFSQVATLTYTAAVLTEDLLRVWGGESLVVGFDDVSQTWMLIAVHSTALGPAMGGTRMKVYRSSTDAEADVLRLAAAMTNKQAMADLPYGGGKAVLAVPAIPTRGADAWRGLFERYGDLVASLGGTYVTAADMHTGSAEMDVIGERTTHVLGRSPALGGSGDSGRDTAVGVLHGIRASCARAFGDAELGGRSVLVQGAGAVGAPLVEMLVEEGAEVLVAELDPDRLARVEARGATAIDPASAIGTPVDVFAPCAAGGILSADTIGHLKCRVVAGAANNQLAERHDADRLVDAGILYAPDYVVNAGGVIHLAGYEALGWDDATVVARLAGIERTLMEVFDVADRERISSADAADRLAAERVAAGRVRS